MKKKYLINSFYFQKQLFEKYLSAHFDFYFSPGFKDINLRALWYIPINIISLMYLYFSGRARRYDIVHFNRAEAFWLFKKIPGQVSIFEIHGFDVGVNGANYLKDLNNKSKKKIGLFIDKILEKKIIRNIHIVDILYCSTPDLIDPIHKWCGRKPIWLPNPINLDLFSPAGEVNKLAGEPACFLAARLHGDKRPEVAIDIFKNHIKTEFPEATLHLLNTGELADQYKEELADKTTYHWHDYMPKNELVATIRGADLLFGDFSIGALSLLPMQIMACKKPIVTLDRYEIIKKEINELPELAQRILNDSVFRQDYVENNYIYIKKVHDPKEVAEYHYKNISKML